MKKQTENNFKGLSLKDIELQYLKFSSFNFAIYENIFFSTYAFIFSSSIEWWSSEGTNNNQFANVAFYKCIY